MRVITVGEAGEEGKQSLGPRSHDAQGAIPLTISLYSVRHMSIWPHLAVISRAAMRAVRTSALKRTAARLLLAGVFAAVCQLASAASTGSAPTILGVRFGAEPSGTRMVIESDTALSTRLPAAHGPSRHVVIDLARLAPSANDVQAPRDGGGLGLVKSWRLEGSRSGPELVLDLTDAGRVTHRFVLPPSTEGGTYRYVIDVARSDAIQADAGVAPPPASSVIAPQASTPRRLSSRSTTPFAAASQPQDAATKVQSSMAGGRSGVLASRTDASSSPPLPVRITHRGRKVIVIDAGHGGHDPGAQAAGLCEKDITLATAMALRRRLEREGGYKVVMTRDSDVFIPLEERVQIARKAGADLFISLHADSAGNDPDPHGASIYTLSDHGETRVNEVLGPREWFSRPGAHAADPAVSRILLDLTQRSTLNRSAQFASLLIDRVSDKIDLLPRTHRDAGYFVLLAPDVPAVLMEMGFISSPRDQARLTDPAQRSKLTAAINDAIDAYFGERSSRPSVVQKTHAAVEASAIAPSPELSPTRAG